VKYSDITTAESICEAASNINQLDVIIIMCSLYASYISFATD